MTTLKIEQVNRAIKEREQDVERISLELVILKKYKSLHEEMERVISSEAGRKIIGESAVAAVQGLTGKHSGMSDRVLEAIRQLGKPSTTKQIRAHIGKEKITSLQLGGALEKLCKKKAILKKMTMDSSISTTLVKRYEYSLNRQS